jgi:hypothetical protein
MAVFVRRTATRRKQLELCLGIERIRERRRTWGGARSKQWPTWHAFWQWWAWAHNWCGTRMLCRVGLDPLWSGGLYCCSGRAWLNIFQLFFKVQNLKFKNMILGPFKFMKFFWDDQIHIREQLSFSAQLSYPSVFWIRNSNLNLVWILKGFKPFLKTLINSQKL